MMLLFSLAADPKNKKLATISPAAFAGIISNPSFFISLNEFAR